MCASGSGPRPSSAASGMPCTLPEGEVSGVLMSEWASIQMHADLLVSAAIELRHARDRADGQRMVAAEHQRRAALIERLHHRLGGAGAGLGNLLQVVGVLAPEALRFRDLDLDVAAVGDLVAERLKARLQSGYAHGRRAHVHAAPAGAQVERHAHHANAPRGLHLGSAGRRCRFELNVIRRVHVIALCRCVRVLRCVHSPTRGRSFRSGQT